MEIKPKDIAEIEIPLPPLPIQRRIVEELDEINAIISIKKKQIAKLDELAQSVFYTMFGDPVINEKGWEVKTLGESVASSCTISYGIVQPGDGVEEGVPVVRPVDLTGTYVRIDNLKKTTQEISDSYSRTLLTGEEVLVCVRGTTGLSALASKELEGCNVTRGIEKS